MPNASVLPVPVRAWPMRSVPTSAIGSVICWIGKGWTIPTRSSASAISGRTPSSRKVVVRTFSIRLQNGAHCPDDSTGADQPAALDRVPRHDRVRTRRWTER
jgi:hypothetical protein